MNKPKVGFIVCASHKDGIKDPLGRPYVDRELINKAVEILKSRGLDIIEEELVVATKKEAKEVFSNWKKKTEIDLLIIFPGTWNWAANLTGAIRDYCAGDNKLLLWIHPGSQGWRSGSGLLVHGALKEIGVEHKLIFGEYTAESTITEIFSYAKAVQIKNMLSASSFCLLGGRGQGQSCGAADPSQWMKMFGIDIDSRSYTQVIEKAGLITNEELKLLEPRLIELFGHLPEMTEGNIKSLRLYLALKNYLDENEFLGVGIQNLPGIGDEYVIPSFAQSMLIEDGIGNSALGDMNVALTTWIMMNASDKSVFYGDIQNIDIAGNELKIVSDGSAAPSLATKKHPIKYASRGIGHEGTADGITVSLVCKEGAGVLAKIIREDGEMQMCISKCSVFVPDENELEDRLKECGISFWPHAFTKFEGDLQSFVQQYSGEYICLGYGADLMNILVDFCEVTGIRPKII